MSIEITPELLAEWQEKAQSYDEICLRRAIEISKTGVYGYSMAHVGLEPLLSVVKARTAEKRGKNDQA